MKYKDKYYKMRYIKAIYIGLIGMLLAGCQADQWESIEGGFLITLSDEVTVTTKSTPAELGEPTTDKFKLKIVNEATNNAAYDGAYKSGTIPAAAGTYTITASFGENPVLALDDPYYKGEETGVVVKDGETTSVNISCSVANALATIFYADTAKFDEMYSSYGVEVKVNNYNYNYSVTIGDGTKKSAYYQAGSKPTFTFKGVLKGNNKEVSKVLENDLLSSASTFEAGQHCKLTLSMEATASGLVPTISKVEASTVTINETIPMEWLPKPKVNGFNDDNQTSLTYTETEDALSAQLRFSGSLAIQDVEFSFEFEDPQEKFQALNDTSFLLSELTEDDRSLLNAASIILPNLDGTNSGQFDFTAMTSSLQTKGNGEETTNTIKLRVKANNRWSSEEPISYEIKTVKPIFSVSAYPGNIWTKEFTMNALMEDQVTKGDFSKLSANMKYQFSTDGKSNWTDLSEDLRKADLEPGTTYYIRGVYRGEICSDPVAVSTYPIIELENGGLENYQIVKGEDKTGSRYGAHYEWDSWCTLNDLTCDDTHAFIWGNTAFNSRSGTRPTTDARTGGDGKAVWISTIGWGYGTTTYHTITPGELFLGTLSNVNHDDDTYTKSYGITYSSRPTALHFWYKYAPFDGDHSDIYIQVLGENQEVLGEASLNNSETVSVYTETTLNITYYEDFLSVPVTSLNVVFKTGNKLSVEARGETGVGGEGDPAYRGSELYIDDISLVYDK